MGSHTNNQRAPNINTCFPGFIYNFNPKTQTCEVQLAIESLFVGVVDAYKLEVKDRLINVPVQFIQGGKFSLTHPVPDGTPCMTFFAQRGISHWVVDAKSEAGLVNGKPAPQFSQLFSVNSATCIIGIQPVPKAIASFNPDVIEIRNENRAQRVTLYPNGMIEIITGGTYVTVEDGKIHAFTKETTVTSPKITLDGDTTVTKSLTVLGGMTVSGGSGAQFKVTGTVQHTGSYKLNGVEIDKHKHICTAPGSPSGPMI